MTKLENQLLDILREDCRIPLEKLAVMTGTDTVQVAEAIEQLEIQMKKAAAMLEYEIAAQLRDEIIRLKGIK